MPTEEDLPTDGVWLTCPLYVLEASMHSSSRLSSRHEQQLRQQFPAFAALAWGEQGTEGAHSEDTDMPAVGVLESGSGGGCEPSLSVVVERACSGSACWLCELRGSAAATTSDMLSVAVLLAGSCSSQSGLRQGQLAG